jgi:hypothetical protein
MDEFGAFDELESDPMADFLAREAEVLGAEAALFQDNIKQTQPDNNINTLQEVNKSPNNQQLYLPELLSQPKQIIKVEQEEPQPLM